MYLENEYPLKDVKDAIKELNKSAKTIDNLIEEVALRTISTVASSVYSPQGSLSLAFYGTAALVYERLGLDKKREEYDEEANIEVDKMIKALKDISVENESNKVKIKWYC